MLNILEFLDSPYGTNWPRLTAVQRFILKMRYNIPLDGEKCTIHLPKPPEGYAQHVAHMRSASGHTPPLVRWAVLFGMPRQPHALSLTEQDYLEYLHTEGRCNLDQQSLKSEFVLVGGRRMGKTLLASIMASYDMYRLGCEGGAGGNVYYIHRMSARDTPVILPTEFLPLRKSRDYAVALHEVSIRRVNSLRGLHYPSSVIHDETWEPIPCLGDVNVVSSPTPALFNLCREQKSANALILQIPTWEALDDYPEAIDAAEQQMHPNVFLAEMGAVFSEDLS